MALSPNPAHGLATVLVPITIGTATLLLLDAVSRVARTAAVQDGVPYLLDLTGLAPGVYALRVQVREAKAVQRLMSCPKMS